MIIAHRGASFTAPENTHAAVEAAWRANADAVEIDVRLTADRRIILMHDPSTRRTTGKHHLVAETDSAVIRSLDAGTWKDPRFTGERVPFLNDIIATMPSGKQLFIEIKSDASILPVLKPLLRGTVCTLIGFDIDTMSRCKEMLPGFPVYWLYEPPRRFGIGPRCAVDTAALLDTIAKHNLDGIDIRHSCISTELCRAAEDAGVAVVAWTVDDPELARRLLDMGAAGITTNRPERLKAHGL